MAIEQYSNLGSTTLNGAINNSVTSIVVTDATKLPSSPNYRIKIGNELLLVTNISTNTLTVTRGVESTIAASHNDLEVVTGMLLTKQSIANFRSDSIGYDLVANRDSINNSGRLFIPSDGNGVIAVNNGSQWKSILNLHNGLTAPSTGNFGTTLNGTNSSFTQNGDIIAFTSTTSNDSNGTAHLKSAPTEPWTVTAHLRVFFNPKATGIVFGALAIRQSTATPGSDMIMFGWQSTTGTPASGFGVSKGFFSGGIVNLLAATALFNDGNTSWIERFGWLRIFQPASGNRTYSISPDGQNWIQIFSESRTAFITPDQVGFAQNNNGASATEVHVLISSYLET